MSASVTSREEPALLSPEQFARVSDIAKREAGLALSAAKNAMISARITRRLRETGRTDFAAYVDFLESSAGVEELQMFISALTTNVTHFFREDHHFNYFEEALLPRLIVEARAGRKVRLWSAGCATGQEPYSIAITILRRFPEASAHDLRILATDIDHTAIARAMGGRYTLPQLDGVTPRDRYRYFSEAGNGHFEAGQALRDLVTFRQMNLVGAWPLQTQFNVIFCRNVVIYFDSETQAALWPRLHRALCPDGVLFIGHSERLDAGTLRLFTSVGVTSYKKTTGGRISAEGTRAWH